MTTGYYRLIEHPDADAITAKTTLAAHRQRVRKRSHGQDIVLLIQDGSDLNDATHQACTDRGKVAKTKNAAGTRGLHAHSTYVVTPRGLPLGVAAMEVDRSAIATPPAAKAERHKKKPPRWIRGLRDSAALVHGLTEVRSIAVMDREGDDFAILHAHRQLDSDPQLLVRVSQDRLRGGEKLFDSLRRHPAHHSMTVAVPRLSARATAKRQNPDASPERHRAACASDHSPCRCQKLEEETTPADSTEKLEWFRYTSLPIKTAAAATEVIALYCRRWKIEEWHRIWKTSCQAEALAHTTCRRQERALAIRAVVAWRLAALTTLGRETPGLDPAILFSTAERAVINDFARDRNQPRPTTLGATVNVLAQMGGYLNRRQDPEPGGQVFSDGYSYLAGMAEVLERAKRLGNKAEALTYLWPE